MRFCGEMNASIMGYFLREIKSFVHIYAVTCGYMCITCVWACEWGQLHILLKIHMLYLNLCLDIDVFFLCSCGFFFL